ncbi:hypothetical protein PsorP6_018138 [Peronosclerospora sorghi]|uniref:Uncharacterized protein n=1 Tax=Peronosclerospora sorghi TaxID=230839 RepID=A0ACC0WEM7_9STRA|nr:hypothetical protein PsorP6_018138 [Peronosclerospora sorghi]
MIEQDEDEKTRYRGSDPLGGCSKQRILKHSKQRILKQVEDALRVLTSVSSEHLMAENDAEQERIVKALTRVINWLRTEIPTTSLHTEDLLQTCENDKVSKVLSVSETLLQVFFHWHQLQQRKGAMNLTLWLLWAEMGSTLDVMRGSQATISKDKSCTLLLMMSRSPQDLPTSKARNNQEMQVSFSKGLWDALLANPLNKASAQSFNDVAPWLVEAFLHWMAVAMRGYEVVFIANVASSFRAHLHATSMNNRKLKSAWLLYPDLNSNPAAFTNEGKIAISALVLSALTSHCRAPEETAYWESLNAATVVELSRQSFSQAHGSIASVGMALGLSSLDDGRLNQDSKTLLQSGNETIMSQFALLRLVNLPLIASDMRPYDDASISKYRMEVHQRVQALLQNPSHAVLEQYSLRMTETFIDEMIGCFRASRERHVSLIKTMQSVLPAHRFRPRLLHQFGAPETLATDEKSVLESAPNVVEYIKQFYLIVAPVLEVLSSVHLLPSFLALCRLEFAREVCLSSRANASMEIVMQKLEQALDQTTTPQETILGPMFRLLPLHWTTRTPTFPPEMDVIRGCQALAVGILLQRKLRILLFQCTPLIDEALALIFSMLYNVFEPADAFSHRFLGVCLSHLTQYIPLFTVFPHYLQVSLAAYPTNASSQELTKACGAIFGALFYSKALSTQATFEDTSVGTTRRMLVWAFRKCCDRSTELLAEDRDVVAPIPTDNMENKADAASGETYGLQLAELVFELMKISPVNVTEALAMEVERLVAYWKDHPHLLGKLKSALFGQISQNCEAEKRAWFAAWYIEMDRLYPVETRPLTQEVPSRL